MHLLGCLKQTISDIVSNKWAKITITGGTAVMENAELKKHFINVINSHYEHELWAFRAEEPYEDGIEPLVNDLIQIAQHYKQGLSIEMNKIYGPTVDPESLDYKIGRRIQDIRMQKGWSLDRLAKKIRMDKNYLLSIERGELLIRIWDLQQVAFAFKIQLIDLLMVENELEEIMNKTIRLSNDDIVNFFKKERAEAAKHDKYFDIHMAERSKGLKEMFIRWNKEAIEELEAIKSRGE